MTDDGFGAHAVVIDEATGCQRWQGDMNGPEPRASYRGAIVKPRLLAFERTYGPVPAGYCLDHCPRADCCIAPAHQVTTLIETRAGRPSAIRSQLAGRLPAERPAAIAARDWAALCGVVAGKTVAVLAAELGISRQRVYQLVERARRKLLGGVR